MRWFKLVVALLLVTSLVDTGYVYANISKLKPKTCSIRAEVNSKDSKTGYQIAKRKKAKKKAPKKKKKKPNG